MTYFCLIDLSLASGVLHIFLIAAHLMSLQSFATAHAKRLHNISHCVTDVVCSQSMHVH